MPKKKEYQTREEALRDYLYLTEKIGRMSKEICASILLVTIVLGGLIILLSFTSLEASKGYEWEEVCDYLRGDKEYKVYKIDYTTRDSLEEWRGLSKEEINYGEAVTSALPEQSCEFTAKELQDKEGYNEHGKPYPIAYRCEFKDINVPCEMRLVKNG